MAEKISHRVAKSTGLDSMSRKQLTALLSAAQTDLAALRAAIVAITAKLDADAGVTDTNYGALCNPAALNFTQ